MNRISLTSSMRSNLLSLQNISRQVSSTQNKLSTGNKVNSAIDNPSSFYTARSLNNRADDLNALLDSMGQAVSTIKAATTALETGADFLEQAAAIATSALETAAVPAKSYFADKGTVVTTAQELKDAVASGKETIIVYGKIDYFENEGIVLKDGQKLVGTEYFTGYTGREKFSQINFTDDSFAGKSAVYTASNSLISDLTINYESAATGGQWGAIETRDVKSTFVNLDINVSARQSPSNVRAGIWVSGGTGDISGVMNITTSGEAVSGIIAAAYGEVNILSGSTANFNGDSIGSSFGIYLTSNATLNLHHGATANFLSSINTRGINLYQNSTANIYSRCTFLKNGIDENSSLGNNNTVNIFSTAELINYSTNCYFVSVLDTTMLNVFRGAVFIDAEKQQKYQITDTSSQTQTTIRPNNITEKLTTQVENNVVVPPLAPLQPETIGKSPQKQYASILSQYDNLMKDASYKGINLLQGDKLNVKFNESGSAALEVEGRDMSSAVLGLSTMDWQTQGDIAQSLKEISAALKSIRSFSAELGNNYSIITSRQDFTENLINILTEGADKLTLADMNEESANMLALQTRQQLAINSLSLASQASQAVLKLF